MRVLKGLAKALVVGACLYCLLFQGIGGVGFLSADEPRYAAVGREMAQSGDWITPRLWGVPWFEKPPLVYWMTAAAWKLGLRDEWAARLPIALVSLAFLVFLQRRLTRDFDSETGWRAAAMLATTAGWITYSSVSVMDVPLSAAFGVTVLLAAPWRERVSPWAGVTLGAAMLAKSLVPLILAVPILWFWRARWRALVVPVAVALAIAAPWYIACYAINGQPFIDELFLRQQFGRFFTDERQHVQPIWFYTPVLLGLLVPWTPALSAVRRDERTRYFLAVAAFGLVFFSLSTNKLPGYLLPLLPPICAAVTSRVRPWALALSGALTAAIPLAALILPAALETGLSRASFGIDAAWLLIPFAFAALVAGVERRWKCGFCTVAVLTAAWIGWAKWTVYPELDQSVSARVRWRAVAGQAGEVCVEGSRDLAYGLAYYHGKPLPDCSSDPRPIRLSGK